MNLQDDDDDTYAVEPMFDSCSEYVQFLMEEEKSTIIVDNEVKEVQKSQLPLFYFT